MNEWHDFFVAVVGAAGALTGLIFVGVSISLQRILSYARLTSRAFQTIMLLLNVVIISSLCLIPGQSVIYMGLEVLLIGLVIWGIALNTDIRIFKQTEPEYKRRFALIMLMTQLSVIPYVISGIVLLTCGYVGVYWLVPAICFSFIKAVMDAWVLLVEIHR